MLLEAKVHKKQHLGFKNSCIKIVTPTMARPSYGIQSALGKMAYGYVFCSHPKSITRSLSRKKTYILMRQFFLRIRSMAIVGLNKRIFKCHLAMTMHLKRLTSFENI
jgi:hypothetical protein